MHTLKRVIKAEKRISHARSEHAEYSSPWHRAGLWRAYNKRQHSKALRSQSRAVVLHELEVLDPCYVVPIPRGRKDEETRRVSRERFRAHWDILSIRYWGARWSWPENSEPRISAWRKSRVDSYNRLCRERRTSYWRRFVT